MQNQSFVFHDNNESAPENVPVQIAQSTNSLVPGQSWGWDGIDQQTVAVEKRMKQVFMTTCPL